MFQQLFELEDCKVTTCNDGKEALDVFQKNPGDFDVMLTDQSMPSLTGMELSQEVLTIRPDFPIIITTGYNDLFSESEVSKSGIKKFLTKPVDINEVFDIITDCLTS
ncbi:MAG: response regulator, partial [Proteobacteria bacterium]|nr:response regulator [Pseudomonadota bacterium]